MVTGSGDPVTLGAGAGVLSCAAGSRSIGWHWVRHDLAPGDAVFSVMPLSIGGLVLPLFMVVDTVIDADNFTIVASSPALYSQQGQGAPALYAVTAGSTTVDVVLPNHGLQVGGTWTIYLETIVAGLDLPAGNYTVTNVLSPYEFQITAPMAATQSTAEFENYGQIVVGTQSATIGPIDIPLGPLSRTEWSAIPNKNAQGTPTVFWFNREIGPVLNVWEVPPVPPAGGVATYYGFVGYPMRQIEDANPVMGQSLDLPKRMMPAFAAELTMALAEKYKPERFAEKAEIAQSMWDRASRADVERVSMIILPALGSYYR